MYLGVCIIELHYFFYSRENLTKGKTYGKERKRSNKKTTEGKRMSGKMYPKVCIIEKLREKESRPGNMYLDVLLRTSGRARPQAFVLSSPGFPEGLEHTQEVFEGKKSSETPLHL